MNIVNETMRYFGLWSRPLFDADLPDEPSTRPELRALNCVDSSPRHGSPGVDGPTASTEQAGAVGHPIDWDNIRRDLAHLRSVLEDALWKHESASAEVLAAARKLDGSQLVQLMIDCGLFERLRDRPAS